MGQFRGEPTIQTFQWDEPFEGKVVFFLEPEPTAFDLNFRIFGIDVRVHPMFWLMSALFGWSTVELGLPFLVVWIVCVFVSILVHEMGHVLAGRLFGTDGHIVLYSFGGLAIGSSELSRRWQRNIVFFSGPLAGFILFGLIFVGLLLIRPADLHPLIRAAIGFLFWINLVWGFLNLLPVWPLDGGRISKETCEWIMPRRGTAVAFLISGIVAALLAINSIAEASGHKLIPYVPAGGWYWIFFFGMLAVGSFQLYQAENNRERYDSDDSPWGREDDWRGDRDRWER